MSAIRIVHMGLGPIGQAVARQVAQCRAFKIVGAIDVDPAKAGRDVGLVIGLARRLGITVQENAAGTLRSAKPDIVVHCTSSSLARVMPELEAILAAKSAIVSTTEELVYPYHAHRRQATTLDRLARRARVAVLGTGVNPGFAMDVLPVLLSAVCERVDRVVVNRVQDARFRRLAFQQKIGAGLTVEQFQARVAQGSVRHVGMAQSIAMIADAMGWPIDRITDEVRPKVAYADVASEFLRVESGQVAGIVQDGVGYVRGDPLITLHLEAYLGAPEPCDSAEIEGSPRLSLNLRGGIPGDIATASMVVNAIPRVLGAAPGLHTMRDLPLPGFVPRVGSSPRLARRKRTS